MVAVFFLTGSWRIRLYKLQIVWSGTLRTSPKVTYWVYYTIYPLDGGGAEPAQLVFISKYSITPLIRINWDGETFGYAKKKKNPDIWILLYK